jgi:hypothetical protein
MILGSVVSIGLLGSYPAAQAQSMVPREVGMPGAECRPIEGAGFNSIYTYSSSTAGFNYTSARLDVQCVVPAVVTTTVGASTQDSMLSALVRYWDNSSDTTGWNGSYTNGDLFCNVTVVHDDGTSFSGPRRYSCGTAGGCSTDANGTFYNTFNWASTDISPYLYLYGIPTSVIFNCSLPAMVNGYWSAIYNYAATFYSRD